MRHTLDVMHVEKNVSENILKTLLGEKDTVKVRKDMEEAGMRPHLWLHSRGQQDLSKLIKSHAPYVFARQGGE